jgi:hypothetical protein
MPNSVLFVDPSVTSASAIVVDGVAYGLIGPTNVTASTSSIDSECSAGCPACPAAPCTCPSGLAETYTINYTPDGGSPTSVVATNTDPCIWVYSSGGFAVVVLQLLVDLSVVPAVCYWWTEFNPDDQSGGIKTSGSTPIGSYTDAIAPEAGATNISVSA